MLGPSAGIGRQNHVEIETSKGVFQSSERWRLEYYSRLRPSLTEILPCTDLERCRTLHRGRWIPFHPWDAKLGFRASPQRIVRLELSGVGSSASSNPHSARVTEDACLKP